MEMIISMYSQVSLIKKIGGRNKVLVIEKGTAVPLHANPGFMGIQEGSSVTDEDTEIKKKGGKYKIKL